MVLAVGQISLVDINDVRQYMLYLNGAVKSQVFDPTANEYAPNFTTNPVVITPELFISGGDGTNLLPSPNVQSIRWYEGSQTTTPLAEGSNTTASGIAYTIPTGPGTTTEKTLTVRSNLTNKTSQIFTCVTTYRDDITDFNVTIKANYEIVKVTNGSSGQGEDGQAGQDAYYLNVWAPKGDTIRNSNGTVEVQADLYKGAVQTTPTAFKWYIQNPSATTTNLGDADGGDGWERLTSSNSHGVTGITTKKITVPASAINGVEGFKSVVTAPTVNTKHAGVIVVRDFQDPISVSILGVGTYKNGQGTNTLEAQLLQAGEVVSASNYTFSWALYDTKGDLIKQYPSVTTASITIPSGDVHGVANLTVDVLKQSKHISTGQITLIDMNDITPSATAPENPVEGTLWLDTSKTPPILKVYKEGEWQREGPGSLVDLDPDAAQQVEDAYNGIMDLDSGDKLTRYERSVVRGELATITGSYLSGTQPMPTLSEIDSSGLGQVYGLRKSARDIGVPTSSTAYTGYGEAYTALRAYLSSLSPKAWDISTDEITPVVQDEWDEAWNNYFHTHTLLNVEVQLRQAEYAEIVGDNAIENAIAAVSNSNQFETVPLTPPISINSPITSLGLPEFEGKHIDRWSILGKNLITINQMSTHAGVVDYSSYLADGSLEIKVVDTINSGVRILIPTLKPNTDYVLSFSYKKISGTLTGFGGHLDDPIRTGNKTFLDGVEKGDFHSATAAFAGDDTEEHFVEVKIRTTSSATPTDRIYIQPNRSDATPLTIDIYNLSFVEGTEKAEVWGPSFIDSWGTEGNRIVPITAPSFSSASTLRLLGAFYGDGTTNDEFYWDTLGRAVKISKWADIPLDGSYSWASVENGAGFKVIRATGFEETAVEGSVRAVDMQGEILTTITTNITGGNQIKLATDNNLFIGVADTVSGWGEDYMPTDAEVSAYLNGWVMCNGTINTPYNGTGNKVWYPMGDTDLSRSTMSEGGTEFDPVPTEASLALSEVGLNPYQVLYKLLDPVQEVVSFDGMMTLLKGVNGVTVTYEKWTPEIEEGTIKYALNLATVTDIIKYIVPTLQTRISSAEEVITSDSIVNTVTSSRSYQLAMSSKADLEALGDYATSGELDDLSNDVDGRIGNALDSIDFSPYVTQSQLNQTALDITAKFSATGGMNVIKNSIGFAGLDFWGTYGSGVVTTLSSNELDTLGFGSGFVFSPDGYNKGITQEISVIPNQPYTLSWYINKRTAGSASDTSYRFFVQVQEDGVTTTQISSNADQTTTGYQSYNFTFTPQTAVITIRFIGYANVDATLTGAMLNIGDVPLQWSLATGELYNTNIRMDINGIRVSQLDENRREVGFTQITPDEFAGYNDSEGNGVFKKIFYLNGDETVTTKLRATEEITMGKIKILKVDNTRKGWAFVPSID